MTSRSGFVYLLALIVVLVASAVCLTISRGVGLRLHAEADATARDQCREAALGVLRAIVNDLNTSMAAGGTPSLPTVAPGGETIGDCTVLLIGRDPAGAVPSFNLIDEAGKVDLADASEAQLAALPGMTTAIAAAIVDWRDADDAPEKDGGAERPDGAYAGAAVPYAPRNAPCETLEELRLVRDVTDALYFGEDANANGRLDDGEDIDRDGKLTRGLRDVLTLESREPANAPDGSTRTSVRPVGQALRARMTAVLGADKGEAAYAKALAGQPYATRLELLAELALADADAAALWPYLTGQEGRLGLIDAWSASDPVLVAAVGVDTAKRIVAARPAARPTSPAWLAKALGRADAGTVGRYLTNGSYQFRADLLAVRSDGRGWARLDASVDCSTGSARVTRIRPAEAQGWPLPWATPDALRRQAGADPLTFLTTAPR